MDDMTNEKALPLRVAGPNCSIYGSNFRGGFHI
jgi:hypothetical protein